MNNVLIPDLTTAQAYLHEVIVHPGIPHDLDIFQESGAFSRLPDTAVPIPRAMSGNRNRIKDPGPQPSSFL